MMALRAASNWVSWLGGATVGHSSSGGKARWWVSILAGWAARGEKRDRGGSLSRAGITQIRSQGLLSARRRDTLRRTPLAMPRRIVGAASIRGQQPGV